MGIRITFEPETVPPPPPVQDVVCDVDPATPDAAAALYPVLDWERSVVFGSYALRLYTSDTAWEPGDIDVPYRCTSHAEFMAEVTRLLTATGATLAKSVTLRSDADRHQAAQVLDGREERFHMSILATATLRVPGVPWPVQLVGMDPSGDRLGNTGLVEHLNHIQDLPACVSYTMADDGRTRIWHVPTRAVEALRTRHVRAVDICAARKDKYAKRGYVFDAE